MFVELGMIVIADRAGLGGAVELSNRNAIDSVKLAVILGREWGTGGENDPQARQIHGITRWRLGEDDEHVRDSAKERQTLPANQLQNGPTCEFPDRIEG